MLTLLILLVVACFSAGTAFALEHGTRTSQQYQTTNHSVHMIPIKTPQLAAVAASSAPNTTPTPTPSPVAHPIISLSAPLATPTPAITTLIASVQPAPQTSVTISSDGCQITANGSAGLIFVTGSYLPAQHGGESNYLLPASYTMTESSGGFKNETAFGELINAAGSVLVTTTQPITATACVAGDPSATNTTYSMPAGS